MDILPESLVRQLYFFETHALEGGPWMQHAGLGPEEIGVAPAEVEALGALTIAARAAHEAMLAARQAALAATQNWYNAQRAMRVKGSGLIKAIKAHSEVVNNPRVYTLAELPVPKSPTNPGTGQAPAAPTNFRGTISPQGLLTLRWDAPRAGPSTGIYFAVQKRTLAGGPDASGQELEAWTELGSTQSLTLTDASPAAPGHAITIYQVQARRGPHASAWSMPLAVDLTGAKAAAVAMTTPRMRRAA